MSNFHKNGIDFYYEVHGDGYPLVFSHGLGGSLERVKDFVLDLPGTRTILYDNRAHGQTRPLADATGLNFARMADDIADLMDHLRLPVAVIGGVSMGAAIALSFAARHAGRTRGLVLSRPAWLDKPNPPNLEFAPLIVDILERHGIAGALPVFQQTGYYRNLLSLSPATADSLSTLLRDADAASLLTAYHHIPASAPIESLDGLERLTMPVLVVANRNDPIHPFQFGETLARAIPASRFQEIVSRFENEPEHIRQFRATLVEYLAGLKN